MALSATDNTKTVIEIPTSKVNYANKPLCLNPSINPLNKDYQQATEYSLKEKTQYRKCDLKKILLEIKQQSRDLIETYAQQNLHIDYSLIKKQAEKILSKEASLPEFTICNLDITEDIPKVGYGLFTRSDAKQFDILGFYSGEVIPVEMQSKKLTNGRAHRLTKNFILSVEDRGIMTFIQSAPNKDEESLQNILKRFDKILSNTKLTESQIANIHHQRQKIICENEWQNLETSAELKQAIAGENCIPIPISIGHKKNKIPLLAIIAKRDLKANTHLLLNYGFAYFHAQKIYPQYFFSEDKEGLILPQHKYLRPTFGPLHLADLPHSPIANWAPLFDQLQESSVPIKLGNEIFHVSGNKIRQSLIEANILPRN